MAAVVDILEYKITGNTSKYNAAIDRSHRKTTQFDGAVVKLGGAITRLAPAAMAAAGTAALGGLVALIGDGVRSSSEWERRLLRTESLIKATGNAAGLSTSELSQFAKQMDLATLGDRDEIMDAINALQTFKSVSGDVFKDAIRLSADLSEVLGVDLSSQAMQLGKALEDPIRGLTSLRRVGVSFSEDQQNLIKSLHETGRAAEAQREILKVLEEQVGGAASGAASGMTGKVDTLAFKWREFKENLAAATGTSKLAQNAIDGLSDALDTLNDKLASGPAADIKRRIEILQKSMEIAKKSQDYWGPRPEHIANLQKAIDLEKERLQMLVDMPESVYKYGEFGAAFDPGPRDTDGGGNTDTNDDENLDHLYAPHYDAHVEEWENLMALQGEALEEMKNQYYDYTGTLAAIDYDHFEGKKFYTDAEIKLVKKAEQDIQNLKKRGARAQYNIAKSLGTALLAAIGADSKAIFIATQALDMGIAIMGAHAGAARTLAEVPYPANIAASAHVLTTGYLEAAAIAAQTVATLATTSAPSGGGGGGSVGTYSASPYTGYPEFDPAYTTDGDKRPHTSIYVEGPFTSEETADYLLKIMKENFEERDVDFVVTGSGSRI